MTDLRDRTIARCEQTDFASMSPDDFGTWIERLPQAEFFALLGLHDEFAATGKIKPKKRRVNVPPLQPHDDEWIPFDGENIPLPADGRCWILYPDGEIGGPNRADAFNWFIDGNAQIVAYAPVKLDD